MKRYYEVVEFEEFEEKIASIIEQIEQLINEVNMGIANGAAPDKEVLNVMADAMEAVACEIGMQANADVWKLIYSDIREGKNWAVIQKDLLVWENDVIDRLKFLEETYGICNICKKRIVYHTTERRFPKEHGKFDLPLGDIVFEWDRENMKVCPICQSTNRERVISLFIDMLQPAEGEKLKILQISPSLAMEKWLREKEEVEYETASIEDVQDMHMIEDESYDMIICSDVLDCVEDDRRTMRELKRVLKEDGVGLFLAPLLMGMDGTIEEFELSSEEKHRLYGKEDFLNRLCEAGYRVHILGKDYFGAEVWKQAGLADIHCLYAATKNDIGIGVEPYQAESVKDDLVSVIIPTYNRGYCIERAIHSVLNQTWSNVEVVIVDDASTDDTQSIIESIPDSRVRYIKLEQNMGANHARNVGIENAKGKYIAFNDSDDEWLSEKLTKQMKLMSLLDRMGGNYGCVYCGLLKYENGEVLETAPPIDIFGENIIGDIYEFQQSHMFISTQTLLLKKEVLDEVGYFNEGLKRLQDWELLLRIAQKYKFALVQEKLVNGYIQKECISKNVQGWIDTVCYVSQLHNMPEKNRKGYRFLMSMAIGMMRDSSFDDGYIRDKIKQMEKDGVFTSKEIYVFKKQLGAVEYNNNMNVDLSIVVNKLSELEQKVDKLSQGIEKNDRTMSEILWAQVFNSSRSACEWLKDDVALWPGRWGVGYHYMYVISRFLNEVQPKNILETGLGQSTRLIGSYVKWMEQKEKCSHLVLEHDAGWIDIFLNGFQLGDSTQIVQKDLAYIGKTSTYIYQNLEEVLTGKKFDFISIDAPYGTDDRYGYSRIDILKYLPECLEKDFCIVLDDYNRWGEKNTVEYIKKVLRDNNIKFCETVYRGTQDMYMLVSPNWRFLCTL